MSGPQGSDANPWQGSGPDQPATGADQPSAPEAPAWQPPGSEAPAWQQPAYPQQYPQYGQPPVPPGYPAAPAYGAAPEYNPAAYGPPPQYGQPGPYGPPPQYGQYPPPPGQYPPGQPGQYPPGQPGQYPPGQYPQYPQPGAEDASQKSMRAVGTVSGVLAALVLAIVLVMGFWKPGFFVTTKLDVTKAQAGVTQILTDESNGYGAKNVKDVRCNNGENPTVKKGDTFNCEVSIDGTKRQVTVTFQDDKGTYEVGRPK
jgi:hypothetical protein